MCVFVVVVVVVCSDIQEVAELTDFKVSPLLLLMLMLRSSEPRAKRFCQKNIEKDQTHAHAILYL